MNRHVHTILLLASFLVALPVTAAVHPNTAGGFPSNQAFAGGDFDNVNLFNGSLTLTIPIGPSFPVNGGFSYRIQLVYNSNPWIFQSVDRVPPGQIDPVEFTQALANPCSNAGMGWRISFGRINPPCQVPDANGISPRFLYQDEMGSDHLFYPTLHPGETAHLDGSGQPDVYYSRDSTYLRLKVLAGNTTRVEFPDGGYRSFDSAGRPTEIRDAYGNGVAISYATANQWRLTDSVGRVQTIVFRMDLTNFPQAVDHVSLMAFQSATPATYTFLYDQATVGRACPHSDNVGPGNVGDTDFDPFLIAVQQPDGSLYSVGSTGNYLTTSSAGCTPNGGNLLSITAPTGAEHRYTWQTYRFPTGSASKPHQQRNPGVATREVIDSAAGTDGTWTYQTVGAFPTGPELKNTVIDPLGHRSDHYFSIALDGAPGTPSGQGPGDPWDYGLPFTRQTTVDGGTLFLSARTLEFNGTNPPILKRSEYVRFERDQLDFGLSGTQLYNSNRRAVRNRTVFEDDGGAYAETTSSDFDGLGHYRQTATSGLGFPGVSSHTHTGNYNPGNHTYSVDVLTNTPTGNFTPIAVTSPWVLPTMTFTKDAEGGQTAQTDLCYRPGTTTVVRQRVRRSAAGGQGGNDLVQVFDLAEPAAGNMIRGNVANERSYGGDGAGQVIATGVTDLCAMGLPATPDYQVDSTYSNGVRATSKFTGFPFFLLNQTIDLNTGLPTSSQDASGLLTSYEFDAMGRITWSKPQSGHDGWTETVYTVKTPTNMSVTPNVLVRYRDNGAKTAPVLATQQTEFDGSGRVSRELKTLPGGVTSKRLTQYDNAGHRASLSEWFNGSSPLGSTSYSNYDAFGRAKTLSLPDVGVAQPTGSRPHTVALTYSGSRKIERTVSVATAITGVEAGAATTELYDRLGRLAQLTEPSGTSGALVTTTYGYDVGGRLSSVGIAGPSTQNRAFTYDAAGLLVSENHPEKGPSGNGIVSYLGYDSRGHLLRKADGNGTVGQPYFHDLTYAFDRAERLTLVKESTGAQRNLKTYSYATANGNFTDPQTGAICFENRLGKLSQQARFNYVTIFGAPYTVEMREAMTYCGRGGRLSRQALENHVNGAMTPNEAFVLPGFNYDALGDLTSLGYPQCTHAGCTAPSPRTVVNSYTNGLLTAVGLAGTPSSYASSITYHPNLMVNQVVHGNNLTDTYALDGNGMSRPASIVTTTSGGTQRWVAGPYKYDGSGNIKAIGSQTFAYDPVSRLTAANLYLDAVGAATARSQTFTYDAFGNLQAIAGNAARGTATSSSTNRLTTGIYDAAGNLTNWNGNTYEYDSFNRLWHYNTGTVNNEWVYLYTADDERVWSYRVDNTSLWTLRAPGGTVLREYANNGTWSVQDDSIYRGGLLLASELPGGVTRHLHLDHLGTPRLISNSTGTLSSFHAYYPYGEEATNLGQDTIREEFTGHERDLGNPASGADDLDYMHARFNSPLTGRFMSVDPVGGRLHRPQSWNRYSYTGGNPIHRRDPKGLMYCVHGFCVETASITVTASAPSESTVPFDGFLGLVNLAMYHFWLNAESQSRALATDPRAAGPVAFGMAAFGGGFTGAGEEGFEASEAEAAEAEAIFGVDVEAAAAAEEAVGEINVMNEQLGHVVTNHTDVGTSTRAKASSQRPRTSSP